jgi:hypothetical protein
MTLLKNSRKDTVEHHALLQLRGETDREAVIFLAIRVHLIWRILCQVVEQH